MTNLIVSEFSSIKNTTPIKHTPLNTVLDGIKLGTWKNLVEPIFKESEKSVREDLKRKLPLFTPTGTFEKRSIAGMTKYNGIVCLDIDNVEDPVTLKKKASKLNYVYAAFITPSGSGVKVIIKTNATIDTYKETELAVANVFQRDTGAVRDVHCKDISRIQYVSYDPDLYLNTEAKIVF